MPDLFRQLLAASTLADLLDGLSEDENLMGGLQCVEAEALAELAASFGKDDTALSILVSHGEGDDGGDRHCPGANEAREAEGNAEVVPYHVVRAWPGSRLTLPADDPTIQRFVLDAPERFIDGPGVTQARCIQCDWDVPFLVPEGWTAETEESD